MVDQGQIIYEIFGDLLFDSRLPKELTEVVVAEKNQENAVDEAKPNVLRDGAQVYLLHPDFSGGLGFVLDQSGSLRECFPVHADVVPV